MLLPDTPPSLASQLLQVFVLAALLGYCSKFVGAGLPAMGPEHPPLMLPDTPPSLASQLLQVFVLAALLGTARNL
jgi:hypothetical protein